MKIVSAPGRLILFFLLVLTFLVYQSGLYGDYEFDDLSNIVGNEKLENFSEFSWNGLYDIAFSGYSGPLKRPVSMGSFALNAVTTGLGQPLYFKLTNLVIHLANGILFYWLLGLILQRLRSVVAVPFDVKTGLWIQCAATGIWLLHPINLTSVLYIVQRMTSLASGFTFIAIGLYVLGRERLLRQTGRQGWYLILGGLIGVGALAIFSKETGVLIPALMFVVEIALFRFACAGPRDKKWLIIFFSVLVLIPTLAFLGATAMNLPHLYNGYALRDFDMSDRLLTQARVLWFYLQLILMPTVSSLGIYHDDFGVSRGLLQPQDTLAAILGLFGLLILAVVSIRKLPVLAFGVLWFFAGHLLESTTLPLEMVHEHRNYLPALGPIFALAYYCCIPGLVPDSVNFRRGALITLISLLAAVTALRSAQWGDIVEHSVQEAINHPNSERANQQLGRIFFMLYAQEPRADYYQGAKGAFERARASGSISNTSHFALLQLAMKAKIPVDQQLLSELQKRLATMPLPPSLTPAMRTLVDCQMFAYCNLPDATIESLLNAAIHNPRASPSITTALKLFLAQYYVDKMGDLNSGAKIIEDALLEHPKNLDLHLNMARIDRVARRFDRAAFHLAEAKRLDFLGNRSIDFAEEEAKLIRDHGLGNQ